MVVSPALQRGEAGQQYPFSPVEAVETWAERVAIGGSQYCRGWLYWPH